MPTITIIRPDESVEVRETPGAREAVVDAVKGIPVLIEGWTRYGGRPAQIWAGFGATDLNLDASAMYLLACAPNMANASDYYLYGPICIVQG